MAVLDLPPPLFVPSKPAIIRRADPGFLKEPYPAIVPGVQPSPGLYAGSALEGFSWTYLQTQGVGSGTSFNQGGVNFGAPSLSRRLFAVIHSFRGSGVNLNLTGTPTIGGVLATIHTTRSQTTAGGTTCAAAIFSAEVSAGASGTVSWTHARLAGSVWLSIYRMNDGAAAPTVATTGAQQNVSSTQITVAVPDPGIVLFAIKSCDAAVHKLLSLTGMGTDRDGGSAREIAILGSQLFPSGDATAARTASYADTLDNPLASDNVVSNWLTWGAAA